jgi:hypothetical protein
MNGVAVRQSRGVENLVDAQIAFAARSGAQENRFVGFGNERHAGICLGVDRHGRNAHLAARPDDPPRDFATVGNEDLLNRSAQRPLAP